MTKYRRILFFVAMEEEAKMLLPGLAFEEIPRSPNALESSRRYAKMMAEREMHLVLPGRDRRFNVSQIGPLAAAVTTYIEVQEFKPDLIINPGSGGGYRKHGASIGDVYLSTGNVYFHDRRIAFPGYGAYGEGAYPSFDSRDLAERAGLKCGVVSSGNSLDITPAEQAAIDKHHAVIKDMEAAAVAWVGWELHVPVLAVKAISDFVDEPSMNPVRFVKNITLAYHNLSQAVERLLELL